MSDPEVEAYAAAFAARGPAPRGRGQVALVVARRGGGVHDALEEGALSIEEGLLGDRWKPEKDPDRGSQLTLMNARVIETLRGGAVVPDSGDNLLVDLDLSEAALAEGTRLSVGTALIEVTAEPHTGCAKFSQRFGSAALRWVNGKPRRSERLRGVHARVIEPGVVRPGDVVAIAGP